MKKLFLFSAVFAVAASPVLAEEEKSPWSGSQDLGYVKKDGNTESEELNAAFKLVYDKHPYRNTLKLEASNSSAEDDTGKENRTAEKYFLSDKADYFLTERSYGFTELQYEDDHFSGYDYQSSFTLGYGYEIIKKDNLELSVEGGPGYFKDERDDGKTYEGAQASIAQSLTWKINKTTTFGEEASYKTNDENSIFRYSIYLQTQLHDSLAFKVTQKVKISDPDEKQPGFTKADRELILSLVYVF